MEEEPARLIALFDFYWFEQTVLLDGGALVALHSLPADYDLAPASAGVEKEGAAAPAETPLPPRSSWLRRTLSDDVAFVSASDSALLAHGNRRLLPILSGKVTSEEGKEEEVDTEVSAQSRSVAEEEINERRACRKKPMERRRMGTNRDGKSRSLSELEFEELKGFMDLGFTFSETEPDQRLLSIVPGLQRLGKRRASEEEEEEEEEEVGAEAEEPGERGVEVPSIQRPYLSEAWKVVGLDERSRRSHAYEHLLRNWRIPEGREGVDMKDFLRSWAHTVASAVR